MKNPIVITLAIVGTAAIIGTSSYFIIRSKTTNRNQASNQSSQEENVPLPQDEDIIRNFVNLVEEGKANEAARMMKISENSPDQANSELQTWAVQFANILSFKLLKLEKSNENEWTSQKHIYKALLDVKMDPRSAEAPIPYYGWQDGKNTRWFVLEKADNTWKIAQIATGS